MMNLFKKPKVYTLSEWLEIATKQLIAPAKLRIRAEIEAHYADAVESHLASGSSEPVAQLLALSELGDAKTAAKRFLKRHLTEREAQGIKYSIKAGRSIALLLLKYSFFVFGLPGFLAWFWLRGGSFHQPFQSLWLALKIMLFIVLPTAHFLMARSHGLKNNLRWLVLFGSLCDMLPVAFILQWFLSWSSANTVGIWLYGLSCALMLINTLRLWYKLGKIGEIGNEVLSLDTAPLVQLR